MQFQQKSMHSFTCVTLPGKQDQKKSFISIPTVYTKTLIQQWIFHFGQWPAQRKSDAESRTKRKTLRNIEF